MKYLLALAARFPKIAFWPKGVHNDEPNYGCTGAVRMKKEVRDQRMYAVMVRGRKAW